MPPDLQLLSVFRAATVRQMRRSPTWDGHETSSSCLWLIKAACDLNSLCSDPSGCKGGCPKISHPLRMGSTFEFLLQSTLSRIIVNRSKEAAQAVYLDPGEPIRLDCIHVARIPHNLMEKSDRPQVL